MKKLLFLIIIMMLANPLFAQEDPMECDVAIRAIDGGNNFLKGYPVDVMDIIDGVPVDWGTKGYLPDFIHLILTDCSADQVNSFLDDWSIKFKHTVTDGITVWQIKVEVDPVYISASDVGKQGIKTRMREWVESFGYDVLNFTNSSMTFNVPKDTNLLQLKIDFADVFDSVLDIRRYYFSETDVDSVVAAGGEMTLTRQQALNFIIDKLDE